MLEKLEIGDHHAHSCDLALMRETVRLCNGDVECKYYEVSGPDCAWREGPESRVVLTIYLL